MSLLKRVALLKALILLLSSSASYGIDLDDSRQSFKKLGYSSLLDSLPEKSSQPIKIAVFDNSFHGYEEEIGQGLPRTTYFMADGVPEAQPEGLSHGLFMAKILNAFMTDGLTDRRHEPELYLFNASGFTNFNDAISKSIELEVDIIVHAAVRDFGNNLDGNGGLFNTQVSRATDSGIVWVNAAGNFAQTTFNWNDMNSSPDGWVLLPGPNHSLPIRCNPLGESKTCPLRLVLSWNDFKDDIALGTNKDLDLVLTDDTLNIIQASSLIQKEEEPLAPGESLYPREIIEVELNPGRYFVRVKNRSENFGRQDKLRIVGESDSVNFEHFDVNENILNPADHPDVITVGADKDNKSSQSKFLNKPDVLIPSILKLKDQKLVAGSSTATAMAAAGFALLKIENPDLTKNELLSEFKLLSKKPSNKASALPAEVLGFRPQGSNHCFIEINPWGHPYYATQLYQHGARLVSTTAGVKLLTNYDPILLSNMIQRINPDDMIVLTPQGLILLPRSELFRLPFGWYEVFHGTLCR